MGVSNRPSNQIAYVQTNRNLIGFYDKLRMADENHYAQLHAKGEAAANGGYKLRSLIGVIIQDYSSGTGDKNVIATYNMEPEQVQFLLSRVEMGVQDFEWFPDPKIFGEPDKNGYSTVHKLAVTRHPIGANGQPAKSPWFIQIANGVGIRVQNKMGGFYMKSGSYVEQKKVFITLTDMDMYKLLKRTDAFIRNFEAVAAQELILKGRNTHQEYVKKEQQATNNSYRKENYTGNRNNTQNMTQRETHESNTHGYASQGYAPQGYAPQGYPQQGYIPQGYAPQGYPAQR